jgi:ferric-dicitrate binding protein FerR (iron transport regulator)
MEPKDQNMSEQNEYLKRAARWLSGNASEEESQFFSHSNNEELRSFQEIWEWTGKLSAPAPSAKLWPKLAEEIAQDEASARRVDFSKKARPDFSKAVYWPLRMAAALFIILLAGWFVKERFLAANVVITQNGQRQLIELADGSRVEMNAASRLRYSKNFLKKREFALVGEAYFSVEPGAAPFIVKTENSRVEVLGTEFNVRARDNTTTVAVASGKVTLADKKHRDVILQSGEMSRVEEGHSPTPPEAANLDEFFAWRQGRLEFQRTPLHLVLAELERQFDVNIQLAHPDSTGLTLTAAFEIEQPITEVLTALCLTFNWEFYQSQNIYIIDNRQN